MKRARCSKTATDMAPDPKKGKVAYVTYLKWWRDFDRESKTVTWLNCNAKFDGSEKVLTQLKCIVCEKFQARIAGGRNFSEHCITGASSIRTSNIHNHTHSDQHVHAIALLQREQAVAQGQSCSSYAPIAVALSVLQEDEKVRLQHKFDIAYFVAKEKMSFRKYPLIRELEARHGVSIGTSYTTETAAKSFVHFIAESEARACSEGSEGQLFLHYWRIY